MDVCVPCAPVEWGCNTQQGAQAQRIFRGLGLRFGGVKCSFKAKLVEEMSTWVSGGAAEGGNWHFVLPLPVKNAPKEQEQQPLWSKVPSSFQTWGSARDWGIVRLVHWNLPVSLPAHDRAAESREWISHLPVEHFQTRGNVWLQGVSSVPPVPAPEESREKSYCIWGMAGMQLTLCMCTACSALTLSPVPPQEVSLLMCVSLTGQGEQTQHVLQFLLNWGQNLPHWKCHQALLLRPWAFEGGRWALKIF